MTKQSTRSQDEPNQQPVQDTPDAAPAVAAASPEADLTVELLDNALIGRHWHPRGLRLSLPAHKARALEAIGRVRILGV